MSPSITTGTTPTASNATRIRLLKLIRRFPPDDEAAAMP
jgi:hypothetical protein